MALLPQSRIVRLIGWRSSMRLFCDQTRGFNCRANCRARRTESGECRFDDGARSSRAASMGAPGISHGFEADLVPRRTALFGR